MPVMTSDDVELGFKGLMVVRARMNDTTPAMVMHAPMATSTIAAAMRTALGQVNEGTACDASHMRMAVTSPTAGGGIFNSSERMVTALLKVKRVDSRISLFLIVRTGVR